MKRKASKGGRPLRHKGERLRKNRTFRVTDRLDDFITVAAEASGRSVSEEIESRLERSVYVDGLLSTLVGDETALLIRMISAAVVQADIEIGKSANNLVSLQVAIVCIIAAVGYLPHVYLDPPYDGATLAGLKIAEKIIVQAGDTRQIEHFYKITKLPTPEIERQS